MLLLLEIGLAIAAWRRGWKGWVLLPLGIGIGLGFLMGAVMGASGASVDDVIAVGLVPEIALVGTLVGMVIKPRKQNQYPGSTMQTGEVKKAEAR